MTEEVDVASIPVPTGGGISLEMADVIQPAIGASGTKTATAAGSADTGVAHLVALTPFVPPVPMVYYRMDETTWPAPGTILDLSGNNIHGDPLGGVAPASPALNPAIAGDPGTCGYGDIPDNTDNSIDAIDSNFIPGSQGSITFWYNSNENWTGVGTFDRLLFDASNNLGNGAADKHFFLIRRNNAGGSLRFVLEDTADTTMLATATGLGFAANTWVHIAVTWDLPNNFIEIYVNGASVATNSTITNGTLGNTQDIYIGDNRDTGTGGSGWSNDSLNGFIDEFIIYNSVIPQQQVNTDLTAVHSCTPVDHYMIAFPNGLSSLTCEAANVIITAHDLNNVPVAVPSGVVLSLSTFTATGIWQAALISGTGVWVPSGLNDGLATYTWPGGESGFEVSLLQAAAGLENVNLLDSSGKTESTTIATEDPSIFFITQGIRVTDAAGTSSVNIGTQISGKDSDTGFGAQTLFVQALQDVAGVCTNFGGPFLGVTVQMASICNDPAICEVINGGPGTAVTIQDNTGTPIAIGVNDDLVAINTVGVIVDFDAQTKAPLVLNYPDAGNIELFFNIVAFALPGLSNDFVVRPFGFRVDNFSPANPAAVDENGGVFTKAGVNFSADVSAVVWEAADDDGSTGGVANDGIPDSNSALSGNTVTPNFGNEVTAVAATLDHTLVAPSAGGAQSGVLTGSGAFSGFVNGVVVGKTMSWDEVGIIQLDLNENNNDYLGGGQDIIGQVPFVGRFTPDSFQVNVQAPLPAFADSCTVGTFTYLDQTFYYANPGPRLRLRGLNAGGGITFNYDSGFGAGGFTKLTTTLPRSYVDQAGAAATFAPPIIDTDVTFLNLGNYNGRFDLRLDNGTNGDAFMYSRVSEEAPFGSSADLTFDGIGLEDTDGVCYDGDTDGICEGGINNDDDFLFGNITGTSQRFGRLVIGTAVGSELLPLGVPFQTEYHDGTGFVINSQDSCTTIGTNLILFNDIEVGQTDGDIQVCGAGGTTALTLANDPLLAGDGGLSFTAPGAACVGYTDITEDLTTVMLGYLLYDWDGVDQGADLDFFDDDPTGRATFGIFSGPRDFIYIREPWP